MRKMSVRTCFLSVRFSFHLANCFLSDCNKLKPRQWGRQQEATELNWWPGDSLTFWPLFLSTTLYSDPQIGSTLQSALSDSAQTVFPGSLLVVYWFDWWPEESVKFRFSNLNKRSRFFLILCVPLHWVLYVCVKCLHIWEIATDGLQNQSRNPQSSGQFWPVSTPSTDASCHRGKVRPAQMRLLTGLRPESSKLTHLTHLTRNVTSGR